MIVKTLTGVDFFDEKQGGVYRGRSMLAVGKSKAGKSVLAMQFIQQGIKQDERCLMLLARPLKDFVIYAESLDFPVSDAINDGKLILLEYQKYVPGRDKEHDIMIPPEGFTQLKEIIESHNVQRIVLDTVLPWVAIQSQQHMQEHVFSFVRALERLNVTSLLTIPKPVSPLAVRLKNALEESVPIVALLSTGAFSRTGTWMTVKYLGDTRSSGETSYTITAGRGICRYVPDTATEPLQPTVNQSITTQQVISHQAVDFSKPPATTISRPAAPVYQPMTPQPVQRRLRPDFASAVLNESIMNIPRPAPPERKYPGTPPANPGFTTNKNFSFKTGISLANVLGDLTMPKPAENAKQE